MKRLQLLLHDRRRRQRGSVLSALLIIVAFLAILIGGLLTTLTDAFVLSRDLSTRVQNEATVTSAIEIAINQLQKDALQRDAVPANCAQDARKPPAVMALNGGSAVVRQQKCTAIVPEVVHSLSSGAVTIDGIHDTVAGRDRYLVANASGTMYSYDFSTGTLNWQVAVGGQPAGPPSTMASAGNSVDILVPVANRMAVFNEPRGGTPTIRCNLLASAPVRAGAAEGVGFPDYAFFSDSNGTLYAYNTRATNGSCAFLASAGVGGKVVGAPLVFSTEAGESRSDEVFVLVTSSSGTSLQHWSYTEPLQCDGNGNGEGDCENGRGGRQPRPTLTRIRSQSLNGTNAVGYDTSSNALPLTMVVATGSGRLDLARISGSFSLSAGASITLPAGDTAANAPYWCSRCPTRPNQWQDLIGVGGTRGVLYLYDSSLSQQTVFTYDGRADGSPPNNTLAITSTPMADAGGDWYFGANDGYVYDVEIKMSTAPVPQELFRAARFGPGGAITSSPVVGTCSSPARRVDACMYFGSSPGGSYFARIGVTRVADLRACLSSADGSTCVGIPRLWALAQVGPAQYWGANGVYVQGWSFYSP